MSDEQPECHCRMGSGVRCLLHCLQHLQVLLGLGGEGDTVFSEHRECDSSFLGNGASVRILYDMVCLRSCYRCNGHAIIFNIVTVIQARTSKFLRHWYQGWRIQGQEALGTEVSVYWRLIG